MAITAAAPGRDAGDAGARACLGCGQLQRPPANARAGLAACASCGDPLERSRWCDIDAACALAVATLLVLVPAVTLPLMRTSLIGASREETLSTCVGAMLGDGWPEMAAMVLLCAGLLPIARFAMLAIVLGATRLGRRPAWLGALFRWTGVLQPWAMPEVFLVGFLIAYLRLRTALDIEMGTGGRCLVAAGLLALFTRAATNEAAVWRAILPDPPAAAPPRGAIACATCAWIAPRADAGEPCPRCGATLRRRRPYAVGRSLALIIAGALLYLPANLLALATLPIGAKSVHYTVLQGVIDLAQAKLLGLALIVLTASFVIPVLKLAAMAWCISSVLRRSGARLGWKLRAHRFVEEIGRWSMVDCFVIACFVPVASYNDFIYGRAEKGAPFFTAVVVLTMIAVRRFDPRLLWDAARAGAEERR